MAIVETTHGYSINTDEFELWSNVSGIGPCSCCRTITHMVVRNLHTQRMLYVCIDCYLTPDEDLPQEDYVA